MWDATTFKEFLKYDSLKTGSYQVEVSRLMKFRQVSGTRESMGRDHLSGNEARLGGFLVGQPGGYGSSEEQFRIIRRRFHGHGGFLRLVDRDQQSP